MRRVCLLVSLFVDVLISAFVPILTSHPAAGESTYDNYYSRPHRRMPVRKAVLFCACFSSFFFY